MTRRLFLLALAFVLLSLALPSSVRAVSVEGGNVRNVPYVIGFRPLNSQSYPYLGQMHLNFNNGIISGTYTDLSIRPGGPFANAHNIAVSGGTSHGNVQLHIRNITFRGTLNGEKMSGSANIRGGIFNWEAHQGSPGSGKTP